MSVEVPITTEIAPKKGKGLFKKFTSGAIKMKPVLEDDSVITANTSVSEKAIDSSLAEATSPKFRSSLSNINFQEWSAVARPANIKKDISKRELLLRTIEQNATSIVRVADVAMMAARAAEARCGGNDGHGIQQKSNPFESKSISQTSESNSGKSNEAGVVKCEHEVDEKTCSQCKGHSHKKAA